MAQPTLRALVRAALRQNNSDLETVFVQLEPFRDNSEVNEMLTLLSQLAQQNEYAKDFYNAKDTDGAIEAMPKRSVVQHVCQQAYELLDDYEDSIDDDMGSFEQPKSEDTDNSPEESDEVNDDTPDGTDDSNPESEEPVTERLEQPKVKPATARQLRQQPSEPVEDTAKPSWGERWNNFLAEHSLAEDATTTGR